LWNCNKDKLADYDLIFKILSELPDKLQMTKITQPYVFPYCGLVPEDKGITGIVIIAESHLSIHTFVEKNYAFIDIFTCKPFKNKNDEETIINYLLDSFEANDTEIHLIQRGKNFPR
jgi:S-adenosylmethionine decarboxylase